MGARRVHGSSSRMREKNRIGEGGREGGREGLRVED